jgi:hypothetical protein
MITMSTYKAIVTIMIESNKPIDTNFVHQDLCERLCEEQVLDNLDYQVTHVFGAQEIPDDARDVNVEVNFDKGTN